LATTVVDVIKVKFDDGREIEARPLKVKYLRRFMEEIKRLDGNADDNVAVIDVLLDCCTIAMEQYMKEPITKEELEAILDLPMMYRIVEGASGIVLDDTDPKP
jgi:hypothetical protein